MDNKIRESYTKIKMPDASKEKIHRQILEMDDRYERAKGNFDGERTGRKNIFSSWKMGVAACLGVALIVPTGVYAAGKISQYATISIGKDKYQAEIKVQNSKDTVDVSVLPNNEATKKTRKYIKVEADFGTDYQLEDNYTSYYVDQSGKKTQKKLKVKEGYDGMYSYSHKAGFEAGKDFYYNVIYLDTDTDSIINLYDQASMKEMTINNHKALLCESNTIQGSRYTSDYNTSYTIDLYVFYEEYGYIIDYCGMQGLGQEKLISLAKKCTVQETTKENASRYEYMSFFHKAAMDKITDNFDKEEVTAPVHQLNDMVKYSGMTYQVTDVKVSSKVTENDSAKYNPSHFPEECKGLWNKSGVLKPYIRETLKAGNGVSEPEYTVVDEETIQPQMVYVTMKVKAGKKDETICLPELIFLEKEGKTYYDTKLYQQYNRPSKIEDAFIDFMPCYFEETAGGTSFWIKELKAGEEQIFHFAYIVDEDMTNNMYIRLDNESMYDENMQYIDISK